ncbi:MAG TPA: glycerol-3-phosphate dehydrogenase/oxidase [Acidimicrobiales bacterium]|nr:glycerol-3-phosphate dehydrogenase/oxidase [Acidimicrobiales bacterium]
MSDGHAPPPPDSQPGTSPFRRDRALARLASEDFDVLVIGGGITGAGVALDAASRGLKTGLVEKDDFASGTSSKSSKLVHGGLRYLQQKEFRLVYENLAERQRLLDNAPHLVSPLPFLIPLFGRSGVVNRSVARVYRTALWLYDLTGGVRIGRRHEKVTKEQALAHLPTLRTDHLVAGFLYWDARTDDARLTLTVARTAVLDHGAVAANHTRVVSLTTGSDGRVSGARVVPDDGQAFDIRASVVVNAAGVWADEVRTLDEHHNPHSIRPAKGIHITVPAEAFPCDIAAVIPVREDHRSIFVVSWDDQVYLGTTDTEYDGPLDDPDCLPEDVDYILAAADAVVTRPITRADITGVWTGLRPLLAPAEGKHALSERTADLSRRHTVRTSATGVVTVTGGKLTTYRKMAEDTVDEVTRELGRRSLRCVTKNLRLHGAGTGDHAPPMPGGAPAHPRAVDRTPAEAAAMHLAGRFGTDTPAVLAITDGRPDLLDPLVPGLHYLRAEAVFGVREEMARSIADILDRRTRARLRDARASAAAAAAVASLIGPELGWDEERCRLEAETYSSGIQEQLAKAGLDPIGTGPRGGRVASESP